MWTRDRSPGSAARFVGGFDRLLLAAVSWLSKRDGVGAGTRRTGCKAVIRGQGEERQRQRQRQGATTIRGGKRCGERRRAMARRPMKTEREVSERLCAKLRVGQRAASTERRGPASA